MSVLQVINENNCFTKQKIFTGSVMGRLMDSEHLRGVLKYDEPMSRHTTWRVGGNAECYFEPADLEELCIFLKTIPVDTSIMWIGMGSNLLVREGGIRGIVISMTGVLDGFEITGETRVWAGAGIPCAKVARQSARSGLSGAEFLAGIPGTLGGALAMNAGAFGSETWDIVTSVEVLNRSGERTNKLKDEFIIEYRNVNISNDEWFISAELQLEPDADKSALHRINQFLDKRAAAQPLGQSSCGSVFRNPEGDFAARLIEKSRLKGFCIGKACVSEKHANFIINQGGATANDIETLINHVMEVVRNDHGINLVPEVKIVGEA